MLNFALRQVSSSTRLVVWMSFICFVSAGWGLAFLNTDGSGLAWVCLTDQKVLGIRDAVPIFFMWTSMSLVMMFPMAGPMLSVYLDITEIAEQKGSPAVHCGVLAAGFLLVWLGFGTAMTVVQIVGSLIATAPTSGPFAAAALLLLAGAYQFSPFRNECLVKCRNPMLYFLANWSDRTVSVLKMGSAQGLNCLGCCWAIMSLALIGGLMNVIWMALAALLLITEKVMDAPRSVSYGMGTGLVLAGLSIVLATQVQIDANY